MVPRFCSYFSSDIFVHRAHVSALGLAVNVNPGGYFALFDKVHWRIVSSVNRLPPTQHAALLDVLPFVNEIRRTVTL
jgi:hypothetical protein